MMEVFKSFCFRNVIRVWGVCILVYSFMLFQFWWGDHDWGYLKNGIKFADGFFEARFSIHLFSSVLFEGHILPIVWPVLTLGLLALFSGIIARYLEVPERNPEWIMFLLLICLSPYTFILFYYVFLSLSFVFWGTIAVALLFLSEKPYNWLKFCLGTVGFVFVLGSYPPIFSLCAVLFCGRKILQYIETEQTMKKILLSSGFLLGQVLCAYFIYDFIIDILYQKKLISAGMYNIQVNSVSEMRGHLLDEMINFMKNGLFLYDNLGLGYALFFVLLICLSCFFVVQSGINKIIAVFMLVVLFGASRVIFLISGNAYMAAFRVGFWEITGLISFSLAVLLKVRQKGVRNFVFVGSLLFLFLFVRADYEIQKVVNLGFKAERLYQKRVEERLFFEPQFDLGARYAVINFGYPDFHGRFCVDNRHNFNNEILNPTVLPTDFGKVIFWDEVKSPVVAKYGIWSKMLWRVSDKELENDFGKGVNDEDLLKMRYWMYVEAQMYPSVNSIFSDNGFLIFNLSDKVFRKERETFFEGLGSRR